jgi:hypothetical protein
MFLIKTTQKSEEKLCEKIAKHPQWFQATFSFAEDQPLKRH